jgi:hypothetical protein
LEDWTPISEPKLPPFPRCEITFGLRPLKSWQYQDSLRLLSSIKQPQTIKNPNLILLKLYLLPDFRECLSSEKCHTTHPTRILN